MLSQKERLAGLSNDLVRRVGVIERALKQGRLGDAESEALFAMALAPNQPEILRLFGMVQFKRSNYDGAIQTLLQARALRPQDPLVHAYLGGAYQATMDHAHALEALREACRVGPDVASCWFNLGRILLATGDSQSAVDAFKRAIALAPEHGPARTMLADIMRNDGNFEEAQAQFRQVIAKRASAGYAWWGLAMLKPMPLGAKDIARMQQILAERNTAPEPDLIAIWFALALALEHQGEYARALSTLAHAHGMMSRRELWNADEFHSRVDGILQAHAPPVVGADVAQGGEAIFIVSLPRSGSTLTEQILASHSQVEGLGELPDLVQIIQDESDRLRQAFPRWVTTRTPTQWSELGQRYLARTQQRRLGKPRFTDKMPGNWLYIGTILAMLPQAKIVIVRRDPLETCFGCYRYLFNGLAYTHDFKSLAGHWRQFDRASRRWSELFPERVREQSYEALQFDQETQTRELLAFCDLPYEEACLNFHSTERRILTPSATQVRVPMRRDTARAANYGALLDPLRAALGLPAFAAADQAISVE